MFCTYNYCNSITRIPTRLRPWRLVFCTYKNRQNLHRSTLDKLLKACTQITKQQQKQSKAKQRTIWFKAFLKQNTFRALIKSNPCIYTTRANRAKLHVVPAVVTNLCKQKWLIRKDVDVCSRKPLVFRTRSSFWKIR